MDDCNQAQDVTRCDLCKKNVVQMHSDTCLVNLCKTCVGEHISSDECEDPKVVKFQPRKSVPIYPMCALHDNKRCEMHCQECNIPVCLICVTSEEHGGHKFKNIVDIFDEKMRGFERKITFDTMLTSPFCIKDLQENISVKHAEQASKLEKRITDLEKEFTTLLDTVSKHGEELKREIDHIVKQLQFEIESMRKNHVELLTTSRTEVMQTLTEIDGEVSSLKETLGSNDINKVFQFSPNDKISTNLQEDPVLAMPVFCAKRIDSVEFRDMFGTLSEIITKPTLVLAKRRLMETSVIVTKIKTGYEKLYSVKFLDGIGIWAAGNAKQIKLFDVDDKSTKRSINTNLSGETLFSVSNQGHLLYAKRGSKTIHIVRHEQGEEFINLQSWEVYGFCVTSVDDLLVVMTNGTSGIMDSKRRKLSSLKINGNLSIQLVSTKSTFARTRTLISVWQTEMRAHWWWSVKIGNSGFDIKDFHQACAHLYSGPKA